MAVALDTNLRDKADFKHNLVVEGPDFSRREEGKTATATIFIGAIVTKTSRAQPIVGLCSTYQMVAGIVEGYTNRDEPDQDEGYWYQDYDVPFAINKYVVVCQLVPGQILWVCSGTQKTIKRGEPLKIVDGVLEAATTGDDIYFVSEEDVTGVANTRKYFRAKVVKA